MNTSTVRTASLSPGNLQICEQKNDHCSVKVLFGVVGYEVVDGQNIILASQ